MAGFSGRGADVKPGEQYTYTLQAGRGSAGIWPYHCHVESHMISGMISVYRVAR